MRWSFAGVGAVLALAISGTEAQIVDSQGCLRLIGSAACPAFSYAYINPSNLTNAFPWMAGVNSVQAFDAAVFQYLSNPDQWQTTKFENQLGCSNATNAVIRWERTVLCSKWVNEQWSLACTAYYNGSSAATSSKMVCQDTCLQYAASETQLVNSTTYCPGPDRTNGTRAYWLNKDFVDCTNWTTLATNNSQTCVEGASNEGNCGYGTSSAQLCNFCRGNNPAECCYSSNTDISVCGYTLPARVTSTSLSPSAASTASAASSSAASASAAQAGNNSNLVGNTGLTKGQLAGTIIGSVLGGLLLLALLGFLIFFCCFRKRKNSRRDSASTFPAPPTSGEGTAAGAGAGAAGMFGLFGGGSGKNGAPPNASEKGLLSANHPANGSSPTMGGDTLYSGRGVGSTGALSAFSGGAAAGGAGGAQPYSMSAASLGSGAAPGAGAGAGAAAGAGASAGAGLGAAAGAFAGGAGKGERTSGNVLPRVRDENQGGNRWIETGADVTVLWPYTASLPDELDLRPGMKIRVLRLYDDAWGTGQVLSGGDADEIGKQGAFPIVCVSEGSTLASGASSTDSH